MQMRSPPCETVGPEGQSTTITCLPTDEKKVNSLPCFPRRKPHTSKFKVDEARTKAEFWGLVVLLPVTLLHNPHTQISKDTFEGHVRLAHSKSTGVWCEEKAQTQDREPAAPQNTLVGVHPHTWHIVGAQHLVHKAWLFNK